MLRVGLTGGIACGKSTVAAMMGELGCRIFDADEIAHEVIEPGQPAHDETIREFGQEICTADGKIDRARLAAIVFADPARLERLNRIVHPRVIAALEERLVALESAQADAIAVIEAALLIEAGYQKKSDRLVVVWCRREQQIERLMRGRAGRGMTREEAERRIAAQMPLEEKCRLADEQVDGSGSLAATRRQVEVLVARLRQAASAESLSAGQGKTRLGKQP